MKTTVMVWDDKDTFGPDELRDEANSLEAMALQLRIEVPDIVEDIKEYADELESGITDEPDEDDYPGGQG